MKVRAFDSASLKWIVCNPSIKLLIDCSSTANLSILLGGLDMSRALFFTVYQSILRVDSTLSWEVPDLPGFYLLATVSISGFYSKGCLKYFPEDWAYYHYSLSHTLSLDLFPLYLYDFCKLVLLVHLSNLFNFYNSSLTDQLWNFQHCITEQHFWNWFWDMFSPSYYISIYHSDFRVSSSYMLSEAEDSLLSMPHWGCYRGF